METMDNPIIQMVEYLKSRCEDAADILILSDGKLIDNPLFPCFEAANVKHLDIHHFLSEDGYIQLPYGMNTFDLCIGVSLLDKNAGQNVCVTACAELYRLAKNEGNVAIIDNLTEENANLIKGVFPESKISVHEVSSYACFLLKKKEQIPQCFNYALTHDKLAKYIEFFSKDLIVIDLLLLDSWAKMNRLPVISSGRQSDQSEIYKRSYRIWEYRQIIKSLGLDKKAENKIKVLDIGGASCHLSYYAALNGYEITSLDINPNIIELQRETAARMGLKNMQCLIMDMRDLSDFPDNSFDMAMSASVFEHLDVDGQIKAMQELARVVRPGGKIAISFDYGVSASGKNEDLPPPHEPPLTKNEVIRRYVNESGLEIVGEPFDSIIYPFWETVYYSPAFIILQKPGLPQNSQKNDYIQWKMNNSSLREIAEPDSVFVELTGRLINDYVTLSIERSTLLTESQQRMDQIVVLKKMADERLENIHYLNSLLNEHIRENRAIIERLEIESEERMRVIQKQQQMIETLRFEFDTEKKQLQEEIERLANESAERLAVIQKQQQIIESLTLERNSKQKQHRNETEKLTRDINEKQYVIQDQKTMIDMQANELNALREELLQSKRELNALLDYKFFRLINKWRNKK